MSKSHLVVAGVFGALFIWLFAPALSGQSSFVFRDAAHFYHPLFEWTRDEWGAGRVPLWNPHENLGVPLVAENTSSVFYPGKLIFVLPLDFTLLYNLYILGHLALAAAAAYALARGYRLSPTAAILAALAYAFSGNVLFQCYNVVFLVGAAWLPLAVLAAERMLAKRSAWAAVGLGAVLAMMTLGGDPQMAYNAGLLAALAAFIRWRARMHEPPVLGDLRAKTTWATSAPSLLGVAALAGAALASIQILPSIEGARQSVRGSYDAPRSLFELAIRWVSLLDDEAEPPPKWNAALLGRDTEIHQRQIYQFSVPPWRAIELVWPNVSGRVFPTHRRWPQALGIEDRVWTPSFYMGLLPLVFAAGTWKLRKGGPVDVRFLSWAVLLSAVASMGTYGWGWFAREFASFFGPGGPAYSDEVGGLYWLMTIVLPGYIYFRYPAKLLVITTLGIAMLAGKGWDAFWIERTARPPRVLLAIAITSLAALVATIFFNSQLLRTFQSAAPETLFGPFDAGGACRDFVISLGHATVVATIAWCLLAIARRRSDRSRPMWTALGLTVIELGIAQLPLVALAPSELWDATPGILQELAEDRGDFRVDRDLSRLPSSWSLASSSRRQIEGLTWDRETLAPKYPLRYGISLADVPGTTVSYGYLELARWSKSPIVLDLLGVRYEIASASELHRVKPMAEVAQGAFLYSRAHAQPHAWIVHRVKQLDELRSHRPMAIINRTRAFFECLSPSHRWSDLAVVESDSELPTLSKPAESGPAEYCRLVESIPSRVALDVRLAAPGLVVLSDLYYPGWTAESVRGDRPQELPIYRTNRVMRGVFLEPGEHRLVFRYRPTSVSWGAAISLAAVTAIVITALVRFRRRRSDTTSIRLPS